MSDAEWITEGADVVELLQNSWGGGGSVTSAKIAKVGARDIVLDNGQRYSVRTLHRSGAAPYSGTQLVAPNDERVAIVIAKNDLQNAENEVFTAWDRWRGHSTRTVENARSVIDALNQWVIKKEFYGDL